MVVVITIVAVAHEGVAYVGISTRDVDGALVGQFVINNFVPLFGASVTGYILYAVAKAKIFFRASSTAPDCAPLAPLV